MPRGRLYEETKAAHKTASPETSSYVLWSLGLTRRQRPAEIGRFHSLAEAGGQHRIHGRQLCRRPEESTSARSSSSRAQASSSRRG